MKAYPLTSLTVTEAQQLQFKLVDAITRIVPGDELLTRGSWCSKRTKSTKNYLPD